MADIRYVFSQPGQKPVHDRFEKESHISLFHDLIEDRARLEIAYSTGTKHSNLFSGRPYVYSASKDRSNPHFLALKDVKIAYTCKKPHVFVVSIPDYAHQDQRHWRIPHLDVRNETMYMYPVRSLDVYLWMPTDATEFIASLVKVLPSEALVVLDEPPLQQALVSPVIQRLEQVVINTPTEPHYPRTESTSTSRSIPFSAPSNLSDPFVSEIRSAAEHAPIASYNPAAPAAPEPIAHREKTPPPPDGAAGTGLAAAAMHEQGTPAPASAFQRLMPAWQYQPSTPSFLNNQPFSPWVNPPVMHLPLPPPPQMTIVPVQEYAFAPPPQTRNLAKAANSFVPPPTLPISMLAPPPQEVLPATSSTTRTSFVAPPPSVPSFAPPPTSSPSPPSAAPHTPPQQGSTAPIRTPSSVSSHTNDVVSQHTPVPDGGYSTYSYAPSTPTDQQSPHDAYAIHASVYRPTPEDMGGAGGFKAMGPTKGKKEATPGKLEVKADRLEKGVNKWLKRLDKGW